METKAKDKAAAVTTGNGHVKVFSLDGGNSYLKASYNKVLVKFPSAVAEIDPSVVEIDTANLRNSAYVEFEGRHYVVGGLAQSMGGAPLYLAGKADYTHVMFMAAFVNSAERIGNFPVIEKLKVLVPDARQTQLRNTWNDVADRIKSIQSFSVNGQLVRPQVRSVEFISEGVPAYYWAKRALPQFSEFAQKPGVKAQAVLDVGCGETSFVPYDLESGQILWQQCRTLEGVAGIAQRVAVRLKPQFRVTPDAAVILRAMHLGTFQYEAEGLTVDFTEDFETARKDWIKSIALQLLPVLGNEFGCAVVVGGGAHYCKSLHEASKGRFIVATHPEISPQDINVIAMGAMG